MTSKEKKLVSLVKRSMAQVKKGHPLKDYMDHDEIEEALNLLVRIAKSEQDLRKERNQLSKELYG